MSGFGVKRDVVGFQMKWEVGRARILVGCYAVLARISAQSECPGPIARGSKSPPNILLILADDQRWDTIASTG